MHEQSIAEAVKDPKFLARFWAKVNKTEGCWLWTSSVCGKYPYGTFWIIGVNNAKAHRVSWTAAYGRIPDGMNVLHRCDVGLCVRPDHLFIGTLSDNVQDALRKDRYYRLSGTRNGRAVLSEENVREIRRLRADGASVNDIMERFSICDTHARSILSRQRWKHIP